MTWQSIGDAANRVVEKANAYRILRKELIEQHGLTDDDQALLDTLMAKMTSWTSWLRCCAEVASWKPGSLQTSSRLTLSKLETTASLRRLKDCARSRYISWAS